MSATGNAINAPLTFNVELSHKAKRTIKSITSLPPELIKLVLGYAIHPVFSKASFTAVELSLPGGPVDLVKQREHEVFFLITTKLNKVLVIVNLLQNGALTELVCQRDDNNPPPGAENTTLVRRGESIYCMTRETGPNGEVCTMLNRWSITDTTLAFHSKAKVSDVASDYFLLEFDTVSRVFLLDADTFRFMHEDQNSIVEETFCLRRSMGADADNLERRIKNLSEYFDLVSPCTQPYSADWPANEKLESSSIFCHGISWNSSIATPWYSWCGARKGPLTLELFDGDESIATLTSTERDFSGKVSVFPAISSALCLSQSAGRGCCYFMNFA